MLGAPYTYLVAAALAAVVYLLGPWSVTAIGVQYIAHELAAVLAIIIALRWHRPERRTHWYLLAATLTIWALGDVPWYRNAARGEVPFPSVSDALYLTGYVLLAAALMRLVGRRPRAGDHLDALLVTVGLGVPIWLLAVGPAWAANGAGLGGRLVGTTYALLVLVLLFLVSRAAFAGAARTVSGRLLVFGVIALIAANIGYSVDLLQDLYAPGAGLDVGWLVFFASTAAAALHPSMAVAGTDVETSVIRPPRRIAFVWAVACVPAFTILGEVGLGEARIELLSVAAIGTLLAVTLMAIRVLLLLEQSRRAARTEGEQRLQALVSRIRDVISLYDRSGRLTWVSPAIRDVWGFDDPPLRDLYDLVEPLDRRAVQDAFAEVTTSEVGSQRRIEARIDTPAMGVRDVELTLVNHLETPAIDAVVVTFHDVTSHASQRRALEQHAEQQTELATQLERVQEMKDAFLTAVSHDLRTPLTSIRGMSELLQQRGGALHDEQRAQLIERVAANAERLEKLLLELLDLDRMTRGIRRPNRHTVDVDEVARQVLEHDELQGHTVELQGSCPAALVDVAMISSILTNLVGNALKHNPPGTHVQVSLHPFGEGVRIVVEDDGDGIPPDRRDQLVEPFTRLDESRSTEGSGLGLTLVETFTRLHGGRFSIEAGASGGTRCVVELPAVTALPEPPGDAPILPDRAAKLETSATPPS